MRGHAAPKPTVDDLLASREQMNRASVGARSGAMHKGESGKQLPQGPIPCVASISKCLRQKTPVACPERDFLNRHQPFSSMQIPAALRLAHLTRQSRVRDREWPEWLGELLPFAARSVLDPDSGACAGKRAGPPAEPFVTPRALATAPARHIPHRYPAAQTNPASVGNTPSDDRSSD